MESLGSARIEGNRTTLVDLVEKIIENPEKKDDETLQEIFNIEKAIDFIEKNVTKDTKISRSLISEIHKILTKNLTPPPLGEGSNFPGKLRTVNVKIKKSNHIPPDALQVESLFNELLEFSNQAFPAQNHLLLVAISHHRMTWIHPFDNGNGRLVRMFTYLLLIKQGFQVKSGRILNPTAIFCMDRDLYYDKLNAADSGSKEEMLHWCEYVLDGLKVEIEKIDKLLDKNYLVSNILIPALKFALDRKLISEVESKILTLLVKSDEMTLKSEDLETILGPTLPVKRTRMINKLKSRGMLIPIEKNRRIYTIGFANNYLLRGAFELLIQNDFVPASLLVNPK